MSDFQIAYPNKTAYQLVRDRAWEQPDAVAYGFDGVSLIYHRGTHIGFEQPVLDRFHALYPNIDPQRLGVAGGSYGGIMTNWTVTHTDRFKAAVAQ